MSDALPPVVYIAATASTSGVGDFAEEVISAGGLRQQHFHELRITRPDSLSDFVRLLTRLRRLERTFSERRYIVHVELSGGAVVAFWLLVFSRSRVKVATVHDAPWPVWWPLRFHPVGSSRYLNWLLHFPCRKLWRRLERRLMRGVKLVALSKSGCDAVSEHLRVVACCTPIHVPEYRLGDPLRDRPLAVGLFGHVYGSKGFDSLLELRRLLDPRIAIRVAGQGTQNLPRIDGVDFVGPVFGVQEDIFFSGLRLLLLPYDRRSKYGEFIAASSAACRGFKYGIPAVTLDSPVFGELQDAGVSLVAKSLEEMCEVVAKTVDDVQALTVFDERIKGYAETNSPATTASFYRTLWLKCSR